VLDDARKLRPPALPAEPGVYPIPLVRDEEPVIYIGDTDNFKRRVGNYRNPVPDGGLASGSAQYLGDCVVAGG
jgi:excinuclease UvrABC nuclease subunit